jgi:hypothetical protein
MDRTAVTKITSIISVAMLCIGIGIMMITPIVFEMLKYFLDNGTVVEEARDSPLIVSALPTLSATLLILGLAGLGILGMLKNKQYVRIDS